MFAYFVGIALVGAGLGALVAHVGVEQRRHRGDPPAVAVVVLSVLGSIGAMLLQRYVIIVATAFGGAWTVIVGGLAICRRSRRRARGVGRRRLDPVSDYAGAGAERGCRSRGSCWG